MGRYGGGPEILRYCRVDGGGGEGAKAVVDMYGLCLTVHRSCSSATATVCVEKQVRVVQDASKCLNDMTVWSTQFGPLWAFRLA